VSFLKKARGVRCSLLLFLALTTVWVAFRPLPVFAQDSIDRKVKTKVSPTYPELARKMGISGIVKLQLVVALNGAVKETKVIGGHPILVTAAVDAVKKWKFEPASAESTVMKEFKFASGE